VLGGVVNSYAYVNDSPLNRTDKFGMEGSAADKGEKACKLIEKGYNPPNDDCGCQKGIVNDECNCYQKYLGSWRTPIAIYELGKCIIEAGLKHDKCVLDSGGSCACGRGKPKNTSDA